MANLEKLRENIVELIIQNYSIPVDITPEKFVDIFLEENDIELQSNAFFTGDEEIDNKNKMSLFSDIKKIFNGEGENLKPLNIQEERIKYLIASWREKTGKVDFLKMYDIVSEKNFSVSIISENVVASREELDNEIIHKTYQLSNNKIGIERELSEISFDKTNNKNTTKFQVVEDKLFRNLLNDNKLYFVSKTEALEIPLTKEGFVVAHIPPKEISIMGDTPELLSALKSYEPEKKAEKTKVLKANHVKKNFQ